MSSDTCTSPRRTVAGRLRRVAIGAVAVVAGAIILSGCVVIQSESAQQANVIGNSVTISTVLCASNASSAAPCNSPGNYGQNAGSGAAGTLLVGYRIPAGVTAPATIVTSVPSQDENGAAISVNITFTQSPSYSAGLTALVPPPAGTQWVGYESEPKSYTPTGPQTVTLAPSFTLPAGFVGPFTWRTVVGFRHGYFTSPPSVQDVTCPPPFPGTSTPIPSISSVCIDYPDLATINGAPNSLATGDLSITPPATATVAAGSSATMLFAALLAGGNPSAAVFGATVTTTAPGVTPSVTPANFAPGPNSQTNLSVPLTIPATTPAGTYDVTVTATVSGQSRSATGHITVTPKKAVASATATAKLTLVSKATTLKVARKTGIQLTITLSKKSSTSVIATQVKPKVSVTARPTLKAGKKTIIRIKSARFHKGKVTITFKGGGVTRVTTVTLK